MLRNFNKNRCLKFFSSISTLVIFCTVYANANKAKLSTNDSDSYANTEARSVTLAGYGATAIDIVVKDKNFTLLRSFGLDPNKDHDIKMTEFKNITTKLFRARKYLLSYYPGGHVYNVIRFYQWLERETYQGVFYGAIGADKYGQMIENQTKKEMLKARFFKFDNYDTTRRLYFKFNGTVSEVVSTQFPTAGYRLSEASEEYLQWLISEVEHSKIIIIGAEFLSQSFELVQQILDQCPKYRPILVFTIGGIHHLKFTFARERLLLLIKLAHVIFIGYEEMIELFNIFGMNYDRDYIFPAVNMLYHWSEWKWKPKWFIEERMLMYTNSTVGSELMVESYGTIYFPTHENLPELVNDTVGVGSAFMGGFLYGLSLNRTLLRCLKIAARCARHSIRVPGPNYPSGPPTFLKYPRKPRVTDYV